MEDPDPLGDQLTADGTSAPRRSPSALERRLRVVTRGAIHVARVLRGRSAWDQTTEPPPPAPAEVRHAPFVHRGAPDGLVFDLEPGPAHALVAAAFGDELLAAPDGFRCPEGVPVYRIERGRQADGTDGFAFTVHDALQFVGPPHQVLSSLVPFVGRHLLDAEPQWLHLHATAVPIDGQAIVLPGTSGTGKSVLAARLSTLAGALLNDEAVAVDRRAGKIRAHHRPIGLKASGAALVAPIVGDTSWAPDDPTATSWLPAEVLGVRHVEEAPPGAVVLVRRVTGAPTEIAQADPPLVLEMLITNAFDITRSCADRLADAAWLVSSAPALTMTYGEAQDAAAALVHAVRELAPPAVEARYVPPVPSAGRAGPVPAPGVHTVEVGDRSVLYREVDRRVLRLGSEGTDVWRALADGDVPDADWAAAVIAELTEMGFVEEAR